MPVDYSNISEVTIVRNYESKTSTRYSFFCICQPRMSTWKEMADSPHLPSASATGKEKWSNYRRVRVYEWKSVHSWIQLPRVYNCLMFLLSRSVKRCRAGLAAFRTAPTSYPMRCACKGILMSGKLGNDSQSDNCPEIYAVVDMFLQSWADCLPAWWHCLQAVMKRTCPVPVQIAT